MTLMQQDAAPVEDRMPPVHKLLSVQSGGDPRPKHEDTPWGKAGRHDSGPVTIAICCFSSEDGLA